MCDVDAYVEVVDVDVELGQEDMRSHDMQGYQSILSLYLAVYGGMVHRIRAIDKRSQRCQKESNNHHAAGCMPSHLFTASMAAVTLSPIRASSS